MSLTSKAPVNDDLVKPPPSTRMREMKARIEAYDVLVRELFRLLDITEQTDEGRYFRPNKIYSSRALDAEKLEQVLKELKNTLEDRG